MVVWISDRVSAPCSDPQWLDGTQGSGFRVRLVWKAAVEGLLGLLFVILSLRLLHKSLRVPELCDASLEEGADTRFI